MATSKTLLCINNYHYSRGGAEMVYLHQLQLFKDNGWQAIPFSMRHPLNLSSDYEQHFVDEIEFGSDYSLAQQFIRAPKVVYSLEARKKISKLIQLVQPDIAHLHNIYHHISPSILGVLHRHEIPSVLTLHDLKIACPAYKMLNKNGVCEQCKGGAYRNLIKNKCIKDSLTASALIYVESKVHRYLDSYVKYVDRLIAPSQFVFNKMIEWGVPAEKLAYVPNAIPGKPYLAHTEQPNGFLYVGRLGPEKGVATLIKACARSSLKLVVIGTGPEEDSLRRLAESLDAEVDFRGYLNPHEIAPYLRRTRALVLPSEWYENAPISILEAYRDGVPVIGARIGGIGEMVVDGSTGGSFESGSVSSLCEVLEKFESFSIEQIRDMGRAARQKFDENYSIDANYNRLMSIYRELGVNT